VQLVLTEDQELLAKTANDWVREHSPVKRVRELRDANDPVGFSRALWKQMAELGWVGIPFPEAVGGAGMGFADLAVVMEALGRTLAPEPFLSTVLLGGQAIALGGSAAQQEAWLPGVCAGEKLLAFAQQEPKSRYDLCRVATSARADGDGFRLDGEKIQVLDAASADALVVVARTGGAERDRDGITLFLVPKGAAGLSIAPQTRIDHRNAALVALGGVRVGKDAVVGAVGQGAPLLEAVVDRATAGLAAEMLGSTEQLFADTVQYLKTRRQFGVPIGSFQALKHRAAKVYMEVELARSAVMAAVRALDAGDADAAKLISLAKARCSDAFVLAANEGVQMFGGVGMTDEYDVGFYMKRSRVAEMTFGDAAWHRERWARLSGY
jgi:alkylation response protein AidB-like acyl-CoA dehydrogenase